MPPFFFNKSNWFQFSFLLLLILCGAIFFGTLALLLGDFIDLEAKKRLYLYVTQSISSFGVFFIPALLFSWCASKKWFSYSDANKTVNLKMVTPVLLLSLFILPIIVYLGYFNDHVALPEFMHKIEVWMREMDENSKIALQTLTVQSTIPILFINIIFLALLPSVFEEFLFRGTLQPLFSKWFANKHVAIIVTAFIFSAIHFQFFGFIPRFLLGIYLGYLLIWGKSLWLPIIAHFMHNALSLIFDFGAQQRNIDLEAIDPSRVAGFYPVVLVCVAFATIGIFCLLKNSNRFNSKM